MNIVIPTHQKDFHWNIDFLKSFNEKCLDKNESTITFVLSDDHEESIFRKVIEDNSLNNLNLKITNLDYLVKTLGLRGNGLNGIKLPRNLHTNGKYSICLLYTSPSPRDLSTSRMPSSA